MLEKYPYHKRKGMHAPNREVRKGECVYKFNSLGFRGEEYNPNAKKKIFVGGCSIAFGSFLNLEETWAYQFKRLLAEKENCELDDINLLNFASEGKSNDFISRTILSQIKSVKPDLLIVYFTHLDRKEYIDRKSLDHFGPWGLDSDSVSSEKLDYYSYYTEELGFMNMLKNMLLLQSYCKSRDIKYIFCAVRLDSIESEQYRRHTLFGPLIDVLDKSYLADFNLGVGHLYDPPSKKSKFSITVDLASDNIHAGPKSNKFFAEKLFKFYEERIANKSNP